MIIIKKTQVLALLCLLSSYKGTVVEAKKSKLPDDDAPKAVVVKDYAPTALPDAGPDANPNVIGGEDAPAGEYPWYARGVTSWGEWWGCGGTLISPEFVLTAAHCGYDTSSGFQIGALCDPYSPNNNCGQGMETIYAKKVYEHPDWDDYDIDYDFTLVKLKTRSNILPLTPDGSGVSDSLEEGDPLWVIGLGADVHQNNGIKLYPDHVKHAEVSYVDSDTCSDIMSSYIPGLTITDVEMCAGPTDLSEPDVGTCNGDSGGPIMDKATNTLLGVTSWGIQGGSNPYLKCGMTPGVYARISDQWEEWIRPTICDNHSSPLPAFCEGITNAPTPGPVECEDDQDVLTFKLKTDNYGDEVSWGVQREKSPGSNDFFLFKGPYGRMAGEPYDDNTMYEEKLCLPPNKCYKFIIHDSYGDGICCDYGIGGYAVFLNDELIQNGSGFDEEMESVKFGC